MFVNIIVQKILFFLMAVNGSDQCVTTTVCIYIDICRPYIRMFSLTLTFGFQTFSPIKAE